MSVHGIFLPYLFKPHIRRRKCRPIPAYFSGICSLHLIYIRRIRDRHFQNRSQKTIPPSTREASETLCLGLFISCLLSVITMIILQKNAADLSTALLGDPRCEEILILLSYALPLSSIHGCIMGYCYGLKQTQIPAVSQLIEQTARILSVFCLYRFAIRNGLHADISIRSCGNCIRRTVFYLLFCQRTSKEPI